VRKNILAVVFLAICPLLVAQQVMNNGSVIKLVKAGLSEDLIITTINGAAGNYDISADGIIALKSAGASDKVIAAIVAKASTPTPVTRSPIPVALPPMPVASSPVSQPALASPAAPDPNDPMSPHDPGVYLMTNGADGRPQLVFIDRAGAASIRTANVAGAAFSYGIAKAKMKAEIPGPHAPIRARESRPVFYFYFPSAASVGGLGGNDIITSPTQFSIVHLEDKKDHRETAVAKVGLYSAHSGVDEKRETLFTSERLRNGIYKVTPNIDLVDGEYAFIATSGTGKTLTNETVVIYDFGIDR
jgi:hypothetical protein